MESSALAALLIMIAASLYRSYQCQSGHCMALYFAFNLARFELFQPRKLQFSSPWYEVTNMFLATLECSRLTL